MQSDLIERSTVGGKRLTNRQYDVLERIANQHTIKQIGHEFGISESAVNQHIKALKVSLGANSLTDLSDAYRDISDGYARNSCRKPASRKNQVPISRNLPDSIGQDEIEPVIRFQDALAYRGGAPWEHLIEPKVVPEVLNGANAIWVRGASIVLITLGLFVTILAGLGAAYGISSALEGWRQSSLIETDTRQG